MSVFDNGRFAERDSGGFEPYWWEANQTAEQRAIVGDPKNRIGHMKRTAARIDADKVTEPDAVFGPEVG